MGVTGLPLRRNFSAVRWREKKHSAGASAKIAAKRCKTGARRCKAGLQLRETVRNRKEWSKTA